MGDEDSRESSQGERNSLAGALSIKVRRRLAGVIGTDSSHKYKSVWVTLDDTRLAWYKNESCNKELGSFPANIITGAVHKTFYKDGTRFDLHGSQRVLASFRAEDFTCAHLWTSHIQLLRARSRDSLSLSSNDRHGTPADKEKPNKRGSHRRQHSRPVVRVHLSSLQQLVYNRIIECTSTQNSPATSPAARLRTSSKPMLSTNTLARHFTSDAAVLLFLLKQLHLFLLHTEEMAADSATTTKGHVTPASKMSSHQSSALHSRQPSGTTEPPTCVDALEVRPDIALTLYQTGGNNLTPPLTTIGGVSKTDAKRGRAVGLLLNAAEDATMDALLDVLRSNNSSDRANLARGLVLRVLWVLLPSYVGLPAFFTSRPGNQPGLLLPNQGLANLAAQRCTDEFSSSLAVTSPRNSKHQVQKGGERVLKEGWLQIRSFNMRKQWKQRYFILRADRLEYYKARPMLDYSPNMKQEKPRASISLAGNWRLELDQAAATKMTVEGGATIKVSRFSIVTAGKNGKTHRLGAYSRIDRNSWIASLRAVRSDGSAGASKLSEKDLRTMTKAWRLFAQHAVEHCSGERFTKPIKESLMSVLLQREINFTDNVEADVPVNLRQEVNHGFVWRPLLECLKHSDVHLRTKTLKDISVLLINNPVNCLTLRQHRSWQAMLYNLLQDIPLDAVSQEERTNASSLPGSMSAARMADMISETPMRAVPPMPCKPISSPSKDSNKPHKFSSRAGLSLSHRSLKLQGMSSPPVQAVVLSADESNPGETSSVDGRVIAGRKTSIIVDAPEREQDSDELPPPPSPPPSDLLNATSFVHGEDGDPYPHLGPPSAPPSEPPSPGPPSDPPSPIPAPPVAQPREPKEVLRPSPSSPDHHANLDRVRQSRLERPATSISSISSMESAGSWTSGNSSNIPVVQALPTIVDSSPRQTALPDGAPELPEHTSRSSSLPSVSVVFDPDAEETDDDDDDDDDEEDDGDDHLHAPSNSVVFHGSRAPSRKNTCDQIDRNREQEAEEEALARAKAEEARDRENSVVQQEEGRLRAIAQRKSYMLALNILTLVHYDAMFQLEAPLFADLVSKSLDELLVFAGPVQASSDVARALLGALLSKVTKKGNLPAHIDLDDIVWPNLLQFLDLLHTFVFTTSFWAASPDENGRMFRDSVMLASDRDASFRNDAFSPSQEGDGNVLTKRERLPLSQSQMRAHTSPVHLGAMTQSKRNSLSLRGDSVSSRRSSISVMSDGDDSSFSGADCPGIHLLNSGRSADLVLVRQVLKLLHALQLHEFDASMHPAMSNTDRAFHEDCVERYAEWSHAEELLAMFPLSTSALEAAMPPRQRRKSKTRSSGFFHRRSLSRSGTDLLPGSEGHDSAQGLVADFVMTFLHSPEGVRKTVLSQLRRAKYKSGLRRARAEGTPLRGTPEMSPLRSFPSPPAYPRQSPPEPRQSPPSRLLCTPSRTPLQGTPVMASAAGSGADRESASSTSSGGMALVAPRAGDSGLDEASPKSWINDSPTEPYKATWGLGETARSASPPRSRRALLRDDAPADKGPGELLKSITPRQPGVLPMLSAGGSMDDAFAQLPNEKSEKKTMSTSFSARRPMPSTRSKLPPPKKLPPPPMSTGVAKTLPRRASSSRAGSNDTKHTRTSSSPRPPQPMTFSFR